MTDALRRWKLSHPQSPSPISLCVPLPSRCDRSRDELPQSGMPLTDAQTTGLEAAILAYLAAAEGGRFVRTVAAFKEETQVPGGGDGNGGNSTLVVSGAVLEKMWTKFVQEHSVQINLGLDAAILAYMAAKEGGRFARTVSAFIEEAILSGGEGGSVVEGEGVLEEACTHVFRSLNDVVQTKSFFDAIESGDLAEVQLYECVGVDVRALREDGEEENSPLYVAAHLNRLEMVQLFVRSGHDKEVGSRDGVPPLYIAAQEGHAAVVQYLVEQGADKDKVGVDGMNSLYVAAQEGHVVVVQYLVEQGADKDKANKYGASPLWTASAEGHIAVVRYLAEQGVDKDKAIGDGRTPLSIASAEGHIAVVQYLAEQGADKDKASNDGRTPLYTAAQKGHAAVVRCLITCGADKEEADVDGMTPLITACRFEHVDIAEYLLDQGCDRDHADNDGWTAIHWAAANNHLDVAQVLFRYGAKLDARTNAGHTPADVATQYGHHAFADAVRAEEIRRRDHGFKRDRSTIEGTEEHEAAKRPRVEVQEMEAADESDDDDDDDDDDDEEEA